MKLARPKSKKNKPLTETETLVMNVLWDLGDANAQEVLDQLNLEPSKKYAYTTVSTMLRVLESKKSVKSKKEGRGHRYVPLIDRADYQEKATHHLVRSLFGGKASGLITGLLGKTELTEDEISDLKKLLEEKSNA